MMLVPGVWATGATPEDSVPEGDCSEAGLIDPGALAKGSDNVFGGS